MSAGHAVSRRVAERQFEKSDRSWSRYATANRTPGLPGAQRGGAEVAGQGALGVAAGSLLGPGFDSYRVSGRNLGLDAIAAPTALGESVMAF